MIPRFMAQILTGAWVVFYAYVMVFILENLGRQEVYVTSPAHILVGTALFWFPFLLGYSVRE